MLSALRKSDGKTVTAYNERKENGPFRCLECGDPVALKTGRNRINHFAHVNPIARHYAKAESDEHRQCKKEIYEALKRMPNVRDVVLERPMETNRPDVSAIINGVIVAIEVQISSLSIETIMSRTIDYHRQNVYVLWLLPWTPKLDSPRYSPRIWEKWIHAAYFGRVYYWIEGIRVVSYRFEHSFKAIPKRTWYGKNGMKMTGGGYLKKSSRYRNAVREGELNIAIDFVPRLREWWSSGEIKIPDAKLFAENFAAFSRKSRG